MSARLLPTKFNNIIAALSEIAATHHNFVLTGSCALYLQGLLGREPNDIDIAFVDNHYLDWEKMFIDKGFTVTSFIAEGYDSDTLIVNGIQVQFIEKRHLHTLGPVNPIPMEEPFSIIREKYAMAKYGMQKTKHRQDIVTICQNLQRLNANQITEL